MVLVGKPVLDEFSEILEALDNMKNFESHRYDGKGYATDVKRLNMWLKAPERESINTDPENYPVEVPDGIADCDLDEIMSGEAEGIDELYENLTDVGWAHEYVSQNLRKGYVAASVKAYQNLQQSDKNLYRERLPRTKPEINRAMD